MRRIYVGNLSRNTSEEGLQSAFAEFGEVVGVNLIRDKFSGESRGFAFVEMSSDEQADAAIEAMNGKELDGRVLRVDQARPREAGGGGGGGGGGRGGPRGGGGGGGGGGGRRRW
jgi:cold-inducible RNA-binding protein